MRIEITDFAKSSYWEVSSYIQERFGIPTFLKFEREVKDTGKALLRFPNLGKMEPLLEHRPHGMRSIPIGRLTKMIYYIDDDVIYVVDFWPTRRDPNILSGSI
ncbi:MAG: type II toxin-antitoxin system RelE/ParE family toxin [Paludibacteraceae bacterium]|nr:type II toxin-antitoxin system RelE/ParE family toxin [Paludibacteraceae bacterium]